MAISLDDVDFQLLDALQVDADRTNVELARLVGLSPAATLNRVRRLKESGVIRIISAQLDPDACGFPLQVYVTATLTHGERSSHRFDDLIRATPQIIAADMVAGETDYLLTVVARDVAELQQVRAIGLERVARQAALELEIGEEVQQQRLDRGGARCGNRTSKWRHRRRRERHIGRCCRCLDGRHPLSFAGEAVAP